MNNDILKDIFTAYKKIDEWEAHSLPLCAAENITSPFTRLPKMTFLQEKYILGGTLEYCDTNNFSGSDNLYEIYSLVQKQCRNMFHCQYADARTLSGLNAIITILMSLFNIGDTILVTSPEHGGHSSMPIICERLGLNVKYLPYNYDCKDFNYSQINDTLKNNNVKGILIALSDMIEQPQLKRLNLTNEILLYDATQILGLIATGYIENPFDWFPNETNFILLGATHKTIPGPTSGLIMTNNLTLAKKIDLKINPDFLRNVQIDNIVSFLFSLLELESFGQEYFATMRNLINKVALKLEGSRIRVVKTRNEQISETHQMWLSMNETDIINFERNAILTGVSLNVRKRRLYGYAGARLGFQQVARYNWGDKDADIIASILMYLCEDKCNYEQIQQLIHNLSPKTVHFTFDDNTLKIAHNILHNSYMD